MTNNKETTIFLHIPKTAGTSFLSILNRNFNAKKTFTISGLKPFESLEKFHALSQNEKNNLELIQGHRTLGLHEYLDNRYTYITFLRDPIENFFSDYFYIKQNTAHGFHKIVNEMKSFEEYLDFIELNNNDNLQTRHLSGSASHMEKNSIDFKTEGERYYSIAKSNLENLIAFVFIMEEFNEALLILKNRYKIKNISYKAQNITKNKSHSSSFSKEAIQKVEYLCRYDILLYNQAKAKYLQQKQELKINWENELRRMKRNNFYHSKFLFLERITKGIKNRALRFF